MVAAPSNNIKPAQELYLRPPQVFWLIYGQNADGLHFVDISGLHVRYERPEIVKQGHPVLLFTNVRAEVNCSVLPRWPVLQSA